MINKVALKITNYIQDNSNIKNINDLEKINYSLESIFNESFKIVVLIILFYILGKINYFLFSILILFSIRIFTGGFHCSTTMKCLLLSALLFLTTCLIGPILPKLNSIVYYIIALISIFIVLLRTPYPNKNRPIKNKKRKQILKIISTFFIMIWLSILLFYVKDITYLNCGFLTIVLQIIQLIHIRKEVNQ
ncbi:accessory regulator AgrB [Clostridium botulinum]|nr:accessory regulator AgrB [Clostridium botulinum]NFR15907.1 accessory regulator AgrB [Clostridium botulinum]NFR45118.1 accessory regulator AgrB [Clostridium botulinum]NFS52014.1 accessory regulator AgrB [Clostridium botulinum]